MSKQGRNKRLLEAATNVKTTADADAVSKMIVELVGAKLQRPLCDTTENFGATTGGSGSFDDKLIEILTNMQDTVVERAAIAKFGSGTSVKYTTPIQAARDLLGQIPYNQLAQRAVVEFRESDPPTNLSKKITVSARDKGCGMTADSATKHLFCFKSSKSNTNWLQGAYGAGVKATFRNAERIVLITRRAPELLEPQQADEIAITVMEWVRGGKVPTAYYLTAQAWSQPGDVAPLYAFPAALAPEFEPGTQLILASYQTENVYVGTDLRDERTFGSLVDTRLFVPTLPIGFHHFGNRAGITNLQGLRRRLEDNPGEPPRPHDTTTMPFYADEKVYHLPIRYWIFADPQGAGRRRNWVAKGNVVTFTSNGQVHHRWDQADFRQRVPRLAKLADRIFAVVETDELPIEFRGRLFTADRSGTVRVPDAIALEAQVAEHIAEIEELKELNGKLIEEELRKSSGSKTLNAAKLLGAAFKNVGFGFSSKTGSNGGSSGSGTSGGSTKGTTGTGTTSGTKRTAIDLYKDPTALEIPSSITAQIGSTRSFTIVLNAEDNFVPDRAAFFLESDHPIINGRFIVIGNLRKGRARISITVPDSIEEGSFSLRVGLRQWLKSSGGLGASFEQTTQVRLVTDAVNTTSTTGGGNDGTSSSGAVIPILWNNVGPTQAGKVEKIPADRIASAQPEYAGLATLGEQEITVVSLNLDFAEFKKYNEAGIHKLSPQTIQDRKDRYSVAVGVGLLNLHRAFEHIQEERRKNNTGAPANEGELLEAARRSIALTALHIMPEYDKLAREAGVGVADTVGVAPAA